MQRADGKADPLQAVDVETKAKPGRPRRRLTLRPKSAADPPPAIHRMRRETFSEDARGFGKIGLLQFTDCVSAGYRPITGADAGRRGSRNIENPEQPVSRAALDEKRQLCASWRQISKQYAEAQTHALPERRSLPPVFPPDRKPTPDEEDRVFLKLEWTRPNSRLSAD